MKVYCQPTDVRVLRYDADLDQFTLEICDTRRKIYVPWEDFTNASWFIAWNAGLGDRVTVRFNRGCLQ